MDRTKRRRLSGEVPETITRLPEDLQLEILTWVPARELVRCKSVCKLWKSLIGSPPFLPLYRCRNRCLLVYWLESGRIHFHHSPLRHHRTDLKDRFRRLGSLPVGRFSNFGRDLDPITNMIGVGVSGVAVDDRELEEVRLKVISVATGQALRVPPPLPRELETLSFYNLGYDPRSRRYKLLRLIFLGENRRFPVRLEADVITLGPTGTVWEWRKLDDDGAGIRRLPLKTIFLFYSLSQGVRMFSGDGFLCWMCDDEEGMILFDMNRERFRYVKLPADVQLDDGKNGLRTVFPRVLMAEDDSRLSIHLYVLPGRGDKYKPECECFVLEDEEGKVWSKRSVKLPAELHECSSWLGVANGSPLPDSSIMLMSACDGKGGTCIAVME